MIEAKQIKAIEKHGKQLAESSAFVKKMSMIVKKITDYIFKYGILDGLVAERISGIVILRKENQMQRFNTSFEKQR